MVLHIDIDDELMNKARLLSGDKTQKEIVEAALKLFIAHRGQQKAIGLWGKIELDDEAYQ